MGPPDDTGAGEGRRRPVRPVANLALVTGDGCRFARLESPLAALGVGDSLSLLETAASEYFRTREERFGWEIGDEQTLLDKPLFSS